MPIFEYKCQDCGTRFEKISQFLLRDCALREV